MWAISITILLHKWLSSCFDCKILFLAHCVKILFNSLSQHSILLHSLLCCYLTTVLHWCPTNIGFGHLFLPFPQCNGLDKALSSSSSLKTGTAILNDSRKSATKLGSWPIGRKPAPLPAIGSPTMILGNQIIHWQLYKKRTFQSWMKQNCRDIVSNFSSWVPSR